jgi:hypothetical protein
MICIEYEDEENNAVNEREHMNKMTKTQQRTNSNNTVDPYTRTYSNKNLLLKALHVKLTMRGEVTFHQTQPIPPAQPRDKQ